MLASSSYLAHGLTLLLAAVHGIVGNWGWAIILLTASVRLALHPLIRMQRRTLSQVRAFQTEQSRLRERFACAPAQYERACRDLWRSSGLSPLKSMLPILVQVPVGIALYASLSSSSCLHGAAFAFWLQDLSIPDPLFLLPLALGLLLFTQPSTSRRALGMRLLSTLLAFGWSAFMPAGLQLYALTNAAVGALLERWPALSPANFEAAR